MPTKKEETPKIVRYREKALSEPQGIDGVRHPLTRVVEGPEPIPHRAEETSDDLHGWKLDDSK